MRKRGGERVLGPYEGDNGFRVVRIFADGTRASRVLPTERAAEVYMAELQGELERIDQTTASAVDEYKTYLQTKGNKPDSIRQTLWAIELFFHEPLPLAAVTPKKCASLYEEMRTRPLEKTKKPPSVDSHRGILSQVRTFLAWCIERGYIRGTNPAAEVKGIGKRRPRGKSLGTSGNELRVKETRAWYTKALELAEEDDQGAIAALDALLLGMRASEIVSRRVRDVDDDEAPGDLLWIPCAKTPAGRRTLEVPEVLRPYHLVMCEGKAPDRFLYECEREQDAIGKPHMRDWVLDQVHRICDLAKVPRVTAHAMRGLLATLTAERGLAGHMIAATLGHEDERTTMHAYAAPGSAATGVNRRGLVVLNGGVQVRRNPAK